MLGFMIFIGRGINTLEILTLRTTFPHSFPKVESEHERSSCGQLPNHCGLMENASSQSSPQDRVL